jgi:hypothetical protein
VEEVLPYQRSLEMRPSKRLLSLGMLFLTGLTLACVMQAAAQTALERYVATADPNYLSYLLLGARLS